MGLWSRVKAKWSERRQRHTNQKFVEYFREQAGHLVCPFCSHDVGLWDWGPMGGYVWKCECGAVASAGDGLDPDDIGDELLMLIGINNRVSEPAEPAGPEFVTMQAVNPQAIMDRMPKILAEHGYEFRMSHDDVKHTMEFWARAAP